MYFVDKFNNINFYIIMGSGYMYVFIYCFLNCGIIFVNCRCMFQVVMDENFSIDLWCGFLYIYVQIVDKIFVVFYSIIYLLLVLEIGVDKDSILCFFLFMFFVVFIVGLIVVYFILKGLVFVNLSEFVFNIVRDSVCMCQDGVEFWFLVIFWQCYFLVMFKVFCDVKSVLCDKVCEDSKKWVFLLFVKDDNVS